MQKTIAVVFGGVSNENEISVITGTMAANVLKSGGHTVLPVYISAQNEMYCHEKLSDITSFKGDGYKSFPKAVIANGGVYILNKKGRFKTHIKADAVLNCCHGGWGEGGGIGGVCACADLPLASAGVFESSVFMDKYLTKLILFSIGVKTAEYVYITDLCDLDSPLNIPDFPLIVKPVNLGSSIGVELARDETELRSAVQSALIYDSAVIVEKYLADRREINCAAYYSDGKIYTSECEEAFASDGVLTFEDKYKGGGKSVMPADIPADMSRLIKTTTTEVYKKLHMRGIVRLDFIISGGEVYLSEVNTVPGSLSYYLLSGGFKNFCPVLNAVIDQAIEDFNLFKSKKILRTGILEEVPQNALKRGAK